MFQNAQLENGEYIYKMADGSKVYFTVDPNLQRVAEVLISTYPKDIEGLVLFDVKSGKILAISGLHKGEKTLYPFKINKYPAASIFKVITLLSFLENNDVKPEDSFRFCPPLYRKKPQRWLNCQKEYFSTLYQAFGSSNNPLFGRLAVMLGFPAIMDMAKRFYFNDTLDGIPFGVINPIKDDHDLALLGSGFDHSTLNPVQAMRLTIISSTGFDVEPYIVSRVVSKDGNVTYRASVKILERVLREDVVEKFREISVSTVLDGTAKKYFQDEEGRVLTGVKVGGKTGTLRSKEFGGLTEWFVGFAPAEDPEVGVVVFSVGQPSLIKPQYLAMRILQAYFMGKFDGTPIAYRRFKKNTSGL